MYYVFITVLLGLLILGYGLGFAFGCRLPELEERDRERRSPSAS